MSATPASAAPTLTAAKMDEIMAKASAIHTTSKMNTKLLAQFRQRARAEGGGWLARMLARFGVTEPDQLTGPQIVAALAQRPIRDPFAA